SRVGSWLYGTAFRLAKKACRARTRRSRYEARHAPRPPAEPLQTLTAAELLAALDAELLLLPERHRQPLLLCYWQGMTQAEAAETLGCSEGSIKGRLERGRKRLSERLTKRGFAPQVLLASTLAATVPDDLFARTAALAKPAAPIPAAVAALASGGSAIFRIPLAIGAVLTVVALVVAGVRQKAPAPPPAPAPALPNAPALGPLPQTASDALPKGAIARIGTTWMRDTSWINVIAFSADGKRLAWGSEHGRIQICEASTGKPQVELRPDPKFRFSPVTEMAFSPDGKLLAASGFWSPWVFVWDLGTGKPV